MNKTLKFWLILIIAIIALFFFSKMLFVRTVNYEIAGVKIPSKYNMLTGTIKPIINYKGTGKLKIVGSTKSNKMGLTDEQVVIAKLRWAIFEQWASAQPKYKGWRENPDIFRKANEDFKKQVSAGR